MESYVIAKRWLWNGFKKARMCCDIDMHRLYIGYDMAIVGYIAITMHCICVSIKHYVVYHNWSINKIVQGQYPANLSHCIFAQIEVMIIYPRRKKFNQH